DNPLGGRIDTRHRSSLLKSAQGSRPDMSPTRSGQSTTIVQPIVATKMGQPFHVEQSSTAHSTDRKMCLPLCRATLAFRHRVLSFPLHVFSFSARSLALPWTLSVENLYRAVHE